MAKQSLTDKFLAAWAEFAPGFPAPLSEHRFHQTRKWRFDFAWTRAGHWIIGKDAHPEDGIAPFVAVEIDGGTFMGGRHSRGVGQGKDNDKINAAQILGWKVLRFSGMQLKDPRSCIEQVLEAMGVFSGHDTCETKGMG